MLSIQNCRSWKWLLHNWQMYDNWDEIMPTEPIVNWCLAQEVVVFSLFHLISPPSACACSSSFPLMQPRAENFEDFYLHNCRYQVQLVALVAAVRWLLLTPGCHRVPLSSFFSGCWRLLGSLEFLKLEWNFGAIRNFIPMLMFLLLSSHVRFCQ